MQSSSGALEGRARLELCWQGQEPTCPGAKAQAGDRCPAGDEEAPRALGPSARPETGQRSRRAGEPARSAAHL